VKILGILIRNYGWEGWNEGMKMWEIVIEIYRRVDSLGGIFS
jgi:hypothetical protein